MLVLPKDTLIRVTNVAQPSGYSYDKDIVALSVQKRRGHLYVFYGDGANVSDSALRLDRLVKIIDIITEREFDDAYSWLASIGIGQAELRQA